MYRLCVLGGTFDPPHWGHVLLAEILHSDYEVENIVFLPAYTPPHKQSVHISEARHRCQMLRLVCKKNAHFQVDTREINRQEVSYTIDSILAIKSEQSLESGEVAFLLGADNFRELSSWHRANDLVREATLLVAPRPGYALDDSLPYFNDVEILSLPRIDISSSAIRQRRAAGKSIRYFVPQAVEQYIYDTGLYTEPA